MNPIYRLASVFVLPAMFLAGMTTSPAVAQDIVIATGERASHYYQVGRALCRFLQQNIEGSSCLALSTKPGDTTASVANLNNLRGGAIEFALSQADAQHHAVEKTGPFKFMDGDYSDLRAVLSLHSQQFTLIARADAGIKSIDDLSGARVNIGEPGSEQRQVMTTVMAAMGWSNDSFLYAEELPNNQQSLAFCHDRVQAIAYLATHPDPTVRRVSDLCGAVLVDVSGAAIDDLVAGKSYYSPARVPGGLYAQNSDPISTFGVAATLVSSADVEAETVYSVVQAIFNNFDNFKAIHPLLADLEAGPMAKEGLSAPLHEGALRYYNEKGMM